MSSQDDTKSNICTCRIAAFNLKVSGLLAKLEEQDSRLQRAFDKCKEAASQQQEVNFKVHMIRRELESFDTCSLEENISHFPLVEALLDSVMGHLKKTKQALDSLAELD